MSVGVFAHPVFYTVWRKLHAIPKARAIPLFGISTNGKGRGKGAWGNNLYVSGEGRSLTGRGMLIPTHRDHGGGGPGFRRIGD